MFRARRLTAAVLGAALAFSLAVTPAEALVGTRGQHPITGDRNAPSDYAELTYPALPVVVAGQTTTVAPLAFTAPDGTQVTDPAAAGYSFDSELAFEYGWKGDFWGDKTPVGPDGTITFTPEFDHEPGIREAGVVISNPALGTPEYQLVRFQYVDAELADVTDPALDAVSYLNFTAEPGSRRSMPVEVWDRETGDRRDALPEGYTVALGEPDAEKGWSVPSFMSVARGGLLVARPGADEPLATYRVPVVFTETATGRTTTTVVNVEVGDIRYTWESASSDLSSQLLNSGLSSR